MAASSKEEPEIKEVTPIPTALDIWAGVVRLAEKPEIRDYLSGELMRLANEHPGLQKYNVLCIWSEMSIDDFELNKIYRQLDKIDPAKDLLLILHSRGGSAEAAYLISKAIRRAIKKKFIVAVPRKAKSAATLLSLGADEIHMSPIAELGPIDPQLNGLPLLGMEQAVEYVASLTEKYPGATQMFASYLGEKLDPATLGYSSRVVEAAQQYAERLLEQRAALLPADTTPQAVGHKLVYEYKNHGFVVDADEAKNLLGKKIIKTDTEIVDLALFVHEYFDNIQLALGGKGYELLVAGRLQDVVIIGG